MATRIGQIGSLVGIPASLLGEDFSLRETRDVFAPLGQEQCDFVRLLAQGAQRAGCRALLPARRKKEAPQAGVPVRHRGATVRPSTPREQPPEDGAREAQQVRGLRRSVAHDADAREEAAEGHHARAKTEVQQIDNGEGQLRTDQAKRTGCDEMPPAVIRRRALRGRERLLHFLDRSVTPQESGPQARGIAGQACGGGGGVHPHL